MVAFFLLHKFACGLCIKMDLILHYEYYYVYFFVCRIRLAHKRTQTMAIGSLDPTSMLIQLHVYIKWSAREG